MKKVINWRNGKFVNWVYEEMKLLNTQNVMEADPVPFINLFFVVYKKKNSLE